MRILMLLGVLLLAQGCVIVPRNPGRPLSPPSGPSRMVYDEAVNLGFRQCQSRGYQCQLKEAHLTGNDVWKVKFAAFASGGARGHLHLDYNAYTRELLKVNEKVKAHKNDDHHRGHDDDDDGRGHGRGKKKGHGKHDD